MTLKSWWKRCWAGGFWSQSKLSSRKFLFALAFFVATYLSTFLGVHFMGIKDSTIIETGINAIRDVMIAYFAMNVVEAGTNVYAKLKNGGQGQ